MQPFAVNAVNEDTTTPRVAVVTGATGGIGQAIAFTLAEAGHDVVVHGFRNARVAIEMVERIESLGRAAVFLRADLAEPAEQQRIVDEAWAWRGGVQAWVNTAGVDILAGLVAKQSFEEKLEALLTVDLVATMRLSREIGARMKAGRHGVIVNIGWDGASRGMEGDSAQLFAAVKGGVESFSRSLAQSLAPEVRVVTVAPGWIRTAWGEAASAYWQERAARESLMNRWGTPEDVAAVVRFLVSDDASFISGEVINVNGGFRVPR